jgi:hypothetical protein
MAIVPQMTVPTGGDAFSSQRVLAGVNWLYGWDVTEDWSIAGSTQFNAANDDVDNHYTEWAQSITTGRSISENWAGYAEWFAIIPDSGIGVSTEHYFNTGLTYAIGENAQWDIRVGLGLNDDADDYFAGTGISLRRIRGERP